MKEYIKKNHEDLFSVFGHEYRKCIPLALEFLEEREQKGYIDLYNLTSVFLLDISRLCSRNFFKEAVLFISQILSAANKDGFQIEENLGFQLRKQRGISYCEQRGGNRLPEISIGFIVDKYGDSIEQYAHWLYKQNYVYPNLYGIDKENLIRTVSFLSLLISWFINHKFTDTMIEINGLPLLKPAFLQDSLV